MADADDDPIASLAQKGGYDPALLAKVLAGPAGAATGSPTPWAQAHPTLSQFILQALRYAPLGVTATGVGAVPAGAPRQPLGIALSRNKVDVDQFPPTNNPFSYNIFRDSQPIGQGTGTVSHGPYTDAIIKWIGAANKVGDKAQPWSLGMSDLRELMSQFRQDFPEVQSVTGIRTSGARAGQGQWQTVKMPPPDKDN